jgi:hypothetical protein
MKVGRLNPRAFTSYFLTSGHRRGLVVLIRNLNNPIRNPPRKKRPQKLLRP